MSAPIEPVFDYSNRSTRRRGPFLRALGVVLPGVRRVGDQIAPYAEQWERANRRALAQDGPLWVALGDSMTQGVGASAYDRGYVGQLAARLAAAGRPHRVVNLATSGARTTDLLERQLPVLDTLPTPDLVTLLIGSNDLMRRALRDTLPERFGEVLDRLPRGAVVATLPNPNGPSGEVNALVEAAAARGEVRVAEMRSGISWRGRLAADFFHPNDAGYAALAEAFAGPLGLPPA